MRYIVISFVIYLLVTKQWSKYWAWAANSATAPSSGGTTDTPNPSTGPQGGGGGGGF